MYKLILPPDQSSYSVVDGEENLRQILDGGLGRYRRDVIGASSTVNCQWTVDRNNYQYLRSFYNIITESASPFLIDLYIDAPYLTEHTAYFIPNTMRLSSQSGLTFTLTCQIEVEPIDNSEFDTTFIELIQAYGSPEEVSAIFVSLEKLVNVDLPKINYTYVPPIPVYPDTALTDGSGNYLINDSGDFLYGPAYVLPPASTITDDTGTILLDENSNVLVGDFA